jgi:hypothetical protein
VAEGQLTTAEVNAGKVISETVTNRAITVVDGWVRATGTAAATTSVDLVDSVTGTVAVAFGVAGLSDGVILRIGAANTTATNTGTALGTGQALKIVNNGAALATTTALDYCIFYKVEAVNETS